MAIENGRFGGEEPQMHDPKLHPEDQRSEEASLGARVLRFGDKVRSRAGELGVIPSDLEVIERYVGAPQDLPKRTIKRSGLHLQRQGSLQKLYARYGSRG